MKLTFLALSLACSTLIACVHSADAGDAEESSDELESTADESGPTNATCSDARANVLYTSWVYQGGAPPGPGTTVGGRKLVLGGNIVGETVDVVPGAGKPSGDVHPWEYSLQFLAGTKKVVRHDGNAEAGSETFVQELVGTRVAGLGPTIESNQFKALVICESHWNMLAP